MSIEHASPDAIRSLIADLAEQRDEAREDVRRLRETLASQATQDEIAVLDRAVAARILDLRREVTLNGGEMSEADWQEMNAVTRAWERVRNLLGRR